MATEMAHGQQILVRKFGVGKPAYANGLGNEKAVFPIGLRLAQK